MHIHDRFLSAAGKWPDQVALASGGASWTYAEAAERVERVAQALAALFPPHSRVALNVHKSGQAIIAMLGCLRAGMTYVPIDPTSPLARREFILRDCSAAALVVDQRTAAQWTSEPAVSMLNLEELFGVAPSRVSLPRVDDGDLAYILYTSGSTGEPKGVAITHANAAAFVAWGVDYFDIGVGDRVAVHAPLHFDLPVLDIYIGLARGATVCPVDERTVLYPEALLNFLRQHDITVLYAVPSALTALVNRSTLLRQPLSGIRLLLYAGEEFHPAPLASLMGALPNARVFNLYGPIETNVVTALEVTPEWLSGARIPIGYPISNTTVLLIDEQARIIARPGLEGEIVVSGPSVTPGYLNRPELTARSRIHVTAGSEELTCYRTGDFAVWGEGGVLHFLGRRDSLVKTRGFRVDMGEIEATLARHPDLAEVAVVATPHPEYTNVLSAFAVLRSGASATEDDLFAWCRRTLPGYMVPRSVTLTSGLPRTSTGKTARRELVDRCDAPKS